MAHIYRVVYICSSGQHQASVPVSATTPDNAVAAAKTADKTFKQVVSVTQTSSNIIVGS